MPRSQHRTACVVAAALFLVGWLLTPSAGASTKCSLEKRAKLRFLPDESVVGTLGVLPDERLNIGMLANEEQDRFSICVDGRGWSACTPYDLNAADASWEDRN